MASGEWGAVMVNRPEATGQEKSVVVFSGESVGSGLREDGDRSSGETRDDLPSASGQATQYELPTALAGVRAGQVVDRTDSEHRIPATMSTGVLPVSADVVSEESGHRRLSAPGVRSETLDDAMASARDAVMILLRGSGLHRFMSVDALENFLNQVVLENATLIARDAGSTNVDPETVHGTLSAWFDQCLKAHGLDRYLDLKTQPNA